MSESTNTPKCETTPPVVDTHPSRQKVTWAAVGSSVFGIMLIAPELSQHILPFVPEAYRQRVVAGCALVALVAGQILNRKATSNLANTTLPLAPKVAEVKAQVAEVKDALPRPPHDSLPPLRDIDG